MFAVVAVYPSGRRVLVGFGKNVEEADALIAECIAYNGEEKLKEVTEAEMNRLRIERARAIDAELYKDERTTPLNAKTGEEESCEK